MPTPTTSLAIGGSAVAVPGTVVLDKLVAFAKDGMPSLSFYVRGGALPGRPDPYLGKTVSLAIGGTTYFQGDVVSVHPDYNEQLGWVLAYQCLGLRNRGDWVPHTDSNTGTDTSPYNLTPGTPGYIASRAGRSIGEIIADVLQMPANLAALNALGLGGYVSTGTGAAGSAVVSNGAVQSITLDAGGSGYGSLAPTVLLAGGNGTGATFTAAVSGGAVTGFTKVSGGRNYITEPAVIVSTLPSDTLADLQAAGLALIPPTGVYVQGEKLLGAIEGLLSQWAPNVTLQVDPATGHLRFYDLRTFPATTLTMGSDPIDPTPLSRDIADCFQRVLVRGQAWVEAMLLSLTNGKLAEDFGHDGLTNSQAKTAWKPTDFSEPASAQDSGTCTCPSTNQVTVTSSSAGNTWAANFWDQTISGRHGVITLQNTAATGINTFVTRRIVSNTALTAGGTSTLTLDVPLPATGFNKYTIFGLTGGASVVWRLYRITDAAIGAALADQFPYSQPFISASGSAASLTDTPVGSVVWSSNGNPPYNEFPLPVTWDAGSGTILFVSPTYFIANNAAPNDVRFLAAVNTQALQSVSPADVGGTPQYQGTSHTVDGLAKTLTVTIDSWRDPINLNNVAAYAADLLDSVKDAVVEGMVTYQGLYLPALTMGIALNIAGNGYTTGWEAPLSSFTGFPGVPVVECELEWPLSGPMNHVTRMRVSNRRAHYQAQAFLRPDRTGLTFGPQEGVVTGVGGYGEALEHYSETMHTPGGMLGALNHSVGNPFDVGGLVNRYAGEANASGLGAGIAGLVGGLDAAADSSGIPGDLWMGQKPGEIGHIPTTLGELGIPTNMAEAGVPMPGDFGLNFGGMPGAGAGPGAPRDPARKHQSPTDRVDANRAAKKQAAAEKAADRRADKADETERRREHQSPTERVAANRRAKEHAAAKKAADRHAAKQEAAQRRHAAHGAHPDDAAEQQQEAADRRQRSPTPQTAAKPKPTAEEPPHPPSPWHMAYVGRDGNDWPFPAEPADPVAPPPLPAGGDKPMPAEPAPAKAPDSPKPKPG